MRVLGLSELGRRAQRVMQDDARCADLLGVESNGEFHLYTCVVPRDEPPWAGYYSPWARIVAMPDTRDGYRLEHASLSGHWRALDVQGSFEYCVRQIVENRYHLFFG